MGFIPSAETITATAYLTDTGRYYLFNENNDRFIDDPNNPGESIDLLQSASFALSDPDVNYNSNLLLTSGEVPDITGKNEGALKSTANYSQENIAIYKTDDESTLLIPTDFEYSSDASNDVVTIDVNTIPVNTDTPPSPAGSGSNSIPNADPSTFPLKSVVELITIDLGTGMEFEEDYQPSGLDVVPNIFNQSQVPPGNPPTMVNYRYWPENVNGSWSVQTFAIRLAANATSFGDYYMKLDFPNMMTPVGIALAGGSQQNKVTLTFAQKNRNMVDGFYDYQTGIPADFKTALQTWIRHGANIPANPTTFTREFVISVFGRQTSGAANPYYFRFRLTYQDPGPSLVGNLNPAGSGSPNQFLI